ncbi:MAG: hypothetical protein O3B65_05580 [Chloroflexi bacterium]|nr:hypothetical protein [Chloroflexota bacterium]
MHYKEPHGMPEILGSIFSASLLLGGLGAIDGAIWAWGLGKDTISCLLAGSSVGVSLGIFFGLVAGLQDTRMGRRSYAFITSQVIGGPLILAGVIGFVVGVIRRLV